MYPKLLTQRDVQLVKKALVIDAKVPLQKKNYMGKRFWKGKQEWEKVCIESGIQLLKF
jgi:hypothetical protein